MIEESTSPADNDASQEPEEIHSGPRSLRELIDLVSGRDFRRQFPREDAGILEPLPFPFLALVGQQEMKLALTLTLINPSIGGVLLIGPRGTGKTTAVRSLTDLLPEVPRSLCYYGCMPEDAETGGIDSICPDCAQKYALGEPLARMDQVHLVELPLNARIEDVIGGINERAAANDRLRIQRGILAQSDRNLLYIDEVNLLNDEIIDAILDASAQGHYTIRRGPISATYRSRFTLVGSMNPEEGRLRPQIMDRFGLRVLVHGLNNLEERMEAYYRVQAYQSNPRQTVNAYSPETAILRDEIQTARDLLPRVKIAEEVAREGLEVIRKLELDSLRAEITMFEAARAYAAADGRKKVDKKDLSQIAALALRGRQSAFMIEFFANQHKEEASIQTALQRLLD